MEPERLDFVLRGRKAFTRLARYINQLMREQLAGGPITVQQCYALEALAEGPLSMSELAAEVALHQSTLSRIVEKLEKQGFVKRTRKPENQRKVEVSITEHGRTTYEFLDSQCNEMISGLIDLIPQHKQMNHIETIEEVTRLLDPKSSPFQELLSECCCAESGIISIMDSKPSKK